jgi:hypothetical protein
MDSINSKNGSLPATYAFRAARSYGAHGPAAPAAAARGAVTTASGLTVRPMDTARQIDQTTIETSRKLESARTLVAAKVSGGIDFNTGNVKASSMSGAPETGALPLYRHPADKNAAATGVDLGRRLDVSI